MSDPRTRKGRHVLTPEKLSSAIQVTNIPADWVQETVTSVIAGSGPVVDISSKLDPRTGKLSTIVVDYRTSKDCKRAFELLGRIENLPCSLQRIIPTNYADRTELEKKEEMQLTRGTYPWDANLELPFEMVSEVPISRRPTQPVVNKSAAAGNKVVIPDILSKASQHLPPMQPDILSVSDPVSANLSKIPPLQLVEIISNLKILANQDSTKRGQLESFLKTNMDISISVTQALLEMGFINYNAVTQVMRNYAQSNNVAMYSNSSNFNDFNNNKAGIANPSMPMPMNMPPMPQPPFIPPMQQQQSIQSQQLGGPMPHPFGFSPQNQAMGFMPRLPQQPMQQTTAPPVQPSYSTGAINYAKLNTLPQNQQDMIKQVLVLNNEQIQMLPEDQKSMVSNLRKEYIL